MSLISEERRARARRFRMIREAMTGPDGGPMQQNAFAALLEEAAQELFGDEAEHRYSPSLVNRLENAVQPPTFQDIEVYATVDQKRRGKLWLAWDEATDATMAKRTAVTATGYTKLSSAAAKSAKKRGA